MLYRSVCFFQIFVDFHDFMDFHDFVDFHENHQFLSLVHFGTRMHFDKILLVSVNIQIALLSISWYETRLISTDRDISCN